jgi:hypothetical protein
MELSKSNLPVGHKYIHENQNDAQNLFYQYQHNTTSIRDAIFFKVYICFSYSDKGFQSAMYKHPHNVIMNKDNAIKVAKCLQIIRKLI